MKGWRSETKKKMTATVKSKLLIGVLNRFAAFFFIFYPNIGWRIISLTHVRRLMKAHFSFRRYPTKNVICKAFQKN